MKEGEREREIRINLKIMLHVWGYREREEGESS